ncbi:phage head-tail connector protein [Clostridium sp. FP1]|uniref:phage head-tail connector protein n=1 Tax=Clostridium sp. FP1 TaxID=2724076 RepID=UPI0013E952FC|nr:phage head-tail connector protein [Clostridium sp. FP1]MBZ9635591.1 phage head-tail connector protein [Clostridium sp. FP1]
MPLTTIKKCKNYLGPSYIDTEDDFLNDLIENVQATIENYCHRHFDIDTYTGEQHNVNHKIFIKETPIISVSNIVRLDGSIVNTVPGSNDMSNYRIFPGYVELLDYKYMTMGNRLKYVNSEESYVEITYTAGFKTPPADLNLAATKLVVLEYKESRENRLGVEQESEGDVKYTYSKKDVQMPLNISAILDRYKRVSL